jgi:serine phosphatase RsbU (regulator of sigma subunit)/anti-sigma regulatory factor (Ser/Thr protein kinase)/PAS domain-containing protein
VTSEHSKTVAYVTPAASVAADVPLSETLELPDENTQDLLQLLYACPVGLVSFLGDGTVLQINPEAVNLFVKNWGLVELANITHALRPVWPTLTADLRIRPGRTGRLIEKHRLFGSADEHPTALSATLVRVSADRYTMALVDDTVNLTTENALRHSENQLQTLFDAIDEGYCLCEMVLVEDKPIDYRFLKVNPLFEEMTGLKDAVGKTALELVPGLEQEWILKYARVALLRESFRFGLGSETMGRSFDVFATPVEPHGHFAMVFKDQTVLQQRQNELQRSAATNAFRAQLADMLRDLKGAVELSQGAVTLLREHLDTARVLYAEVNEHGAVEIIAAQHCRPGTAILEGQYQLDWQGQQLTADFHARQTIIVHDVQTDERLDSRTQQALQKMGFVSYVMVPVGKHHQTTAILVAHHNTTHQWSQDEVVLIEETAQRTTLAVEQATEAQSRQLRYERANLVVTVLSELEQIRSLTDQAQHFVDSLTHHFCDYATVEVPGAEYTVLALSHRDSTQLHTLRELRDRYRADDNADYSVFRAAAGETQLLRSITRELRADYVTEPPGVILLELLGPRSHMAVPISLGSGIKGALMVGITRADQNLFTEEDLLFLQDAAAQVGVLMAGTRLRQEEHDIAVRLQRALLPEQVAWHPAMVIEARYCAASTYMEVGGDWYDTFRWSDGKVGLVVGDVVGHNLESAAQMGRLRAGTAAMAPSAGSSPAALLDALQGFAGGPGGTKFATASCVVVDPETGELTYSSAGHLPGLVVTPDGLVQRLDQALTAPICSIDIGTRPQGRVKLEPNSIVLLYSDGLIERRGEAIDDGLARLETAALSLVSAPIDMFADQLITTMTEQSPPEDDIVVLCFRFDPPNDTFQRTLPPRIDCLSEFRNELTTWLDQRHTSIDTRSDVLLAATEAATNAIEHAYATTPGGTVTVDIASHDYQLVMTITDQGRWLSAPSTSQDRGRGLAIMKSLTTRFTRTSTANGTTIEMVFAKQPPTSPLVDSKHT